MAKYVYKNTHSFTTMDRKRTIKMYSKVLYAGWGPTACHSMSFAGLHILSRPRAVVTGSYQEKPILPKIMKQKIFNTINHSIRKHSSYPQELIFVFWSAKKERTRQTMSHIRRTVSIKKLKPSTDILTEKARYFKTVKPIKIARSKEVGVWS